MAAPPEQAPARSARSGYAQRSGRDPRPLLERQRALLRPLAEAQGERVDVSTGWQHTIELWRSECVGAVLDFTERMLVSSRELPPTGP